MDVLTLDLNRSASVPGASRETTHHRERTGRIILILSHLRRIASGGSGGDAVATRRSGLLAYTAATIVLGIGLLAITSLTSAPWATIDPGIGANTTLAGPTGGLLLWLLYGLIGSLRILRMPGGSTMTFHMPFVGAAMILGGPTAGAWVGFLASIERRELETQPWYGILANHAVLVISAVVGGVVTKLVAVAMGPDAGGAGLLVPAVMGALVLAVVSTALAAMTVFLREDVSVRALADLLLHQVGRITAIECALVVVLALAYLQIGWWAPVLVAGFVLLVWDNDPMPTPDPMTGLERRDAFDRILDAGVGRLRRGIIPGATLLSIDLDRFKAINDDPGLGHEIGDEVLREVGRRLKALGRRPDDVAGRLGGDELAMWLPGLDDVAVALDRADALVAELCKPIPTSKGTVSIGASVGVVVVQAWGGVPSAGTLLSHGDRAMYAAKRAGGGSYLYDPLEASSTEGTSRP
jgi:diguanylate cyclase (GGDEF)-like protein